MYFVKHSFSSWKTCCTEVVLRAEVVLKAEVCIESSMLLMRTILEVGW